MKNLSVIALAALAATLNVVPVFADEECDCHTANPEGHAPIGVMADHYHKKGEWMTSYRYMFMSMDGNLMGDNELSIGQVGTGGGVGYAVVPTRMYMQMHMFGLMYAPSDNLTLMAMLSYKDIEMDHAMTATAPPVGLTAGGSFTTTSSGIGDLNLGGLFRLHEDEQNKLHLNFAVSLPTGSIDEQGASPGPGGFAVRVLPYPMQLGSGTVDLKPGMTFNSRIGKWTWGAQATATIRLDENSADYKLGNQIEASSWIARRLTHWMSGSFRMRSLTWGNISGRDPRLFSAAPPALGVGGFPVPTADPNRRGGTRLDAMLGANIEFPGGFLKGHRLAFEAGLPLYQYLNGPQLQTDWTVTAGWQYAF